MNEVGLAKVNKLGASPKFHKLRKQLVQRAEYEANLAKRRFMQVDPDHRLVADTLEAAWNEKLRDLEAARNQYEKHSDSATLTREEQQSILGLANVVIGDALNLLTL